MNANRAASVLIGAFCLTVMADPTAAEDPKSDSYTVAVYYWPNFHRDAYHQSKKGAGWTE
ncbi:MAG: hypothetical protein ACYC3X_19580 [Pirellulaceae bacterium]